MQKEDNLETNEIIIWQSRKWLPFCYNRDTTNISDVANRLLRKMLKYAFSILQNFLEKVVKVLSLKIVALI